MPDRPQKITFAEMRESGVRGPDLLRGLPQQHSIAISGDRWPGRAALLLSCCRRLLARSDRELNCGFDPLDGPPVRAQIRAALPATSISGA